MKVVAAETIAELLSRAAASPRKRMNLNLHAELADTTNRFLNAGIAGTYVRPHRHRIDKWELLSVVQGRFDVLTFTSDGVVKNRMFSARRDQVWLKFRGRLAQRCLSCARGGRIGGEGRPL
jgi:cupin fold WbuC family metalloprotein